MRQDDQPRRDYKDLAVFMVTKATRCEDCGVDIEAKDLLRTDKGRALCLDCADLGHLEFLGAGDAALTRRASKYSQLRAIVLKWSRSRKRYERQGILAESAAIDRAEEECKVDEVERALRRAAAGRTREREDEQYVAAFAAEVRKLFPGAPGGVEQVVAEHACRKYSGRVGRSAHAKALEPEPITLAVVAHIRHVHTNYDELLMKLDDRSEARARIRARVDSILDQWRVRPA